MRFHCHKVPVEQIGYYFSHIAFVGAILSCSDHAEKTKLTHQSLYSFMIDATCLSQLQGHSPIPPAALIFITEDTQNILFYFSVFIWPIETLNMVIVGASGDFSYLYQFGNLVFTP